MLSSGLKSWTHRISRLAFELDVLQADTLCEVEESVLVSGDLLSAAGRNCLLVGSARQQHEMKKWPSLPK